MKRIKSSGALRCRFDTESTSCFEWTCETERPTHFPTTASQPPPIDLGPSVFSEHHLSKISRCFWRVLPSQSWSLQKVAPWLMDSFMDSDSWCSLRATQGFSHRQGYQCSMAMVRECRTPRVLQVRILHECRQGCMDPKVLYIHVKKRYVYFIYNIFISI